MAILARIIQFLLWLIVATWLGRKLFGWLWGRAAAPHLHTVPPRAPKPLHRDPTCGTFVSAEISHTLEHRGQVFHFCSADCREKFRLAERHQAGPGKVGMSA